ncbi:MAG TPA: hypothetical protein PKY25_00350 [Bacilli bacterium]|nr:hypothetical protein [Bacilli bacterium]
MAKRKKKQKSKLFSNASDSFKISDTAVFDVFTDFAILVIVFISFILIFVAALL